MNSSILRRKPLATLALATNFFYASTGMAESAQTNVAHGFQMAAVVDRAQGESVIAGNYQEAIETLSEQRRPGFEIATNLCVAYTMTGQFEQAQAECSAALTLSRKVATRRDAAVALSNLGVLAAINGDRDVAKISFERALELDAELATAKRNLEKLSSNGLIEA
jgi:Flp pilus assembly protein TadD